MSVVAAVGAYVKTTVQLAPALSVVPAHVPDFVYFAGAAGNDMLVAAAEPALETTTVCDALVWPTVTLPNAIDEGETLTEGVGLGLGLPPGTPAPCRLA